MTASIPHPVRRMLNQHGLLTFLLFFVPLFPGFIESHTLVYVNVIEKLTGQPIFPHEPSVKKVFGERGVRTLRQRQLAPQPIFPQQLRSLFLFEDNPIKGFAYLKQLFFDARLRSLPHSDVIRSQVIDLVPSIFDHYPTRRHQLLRSALIRQLAMLALTEQALEPKNSIIKVFTHLLIQASATEKVSREQRARHQFDLLETQIKGSLAGQATAVDHEFVSFYEADRPHGQLVTQSDVDLMTKTLTRLSQTVAPEIALNAHHSLHLLKPLLLQLS